jgi:hypothetical protein
MIRKFASLLLLLLFKSTFSFAQLPKLKFNSNQSPTYEEMVRSYQQIDSMSEFMQLQKIGLSDQGNLLHVLVVNKKKRFEPNAIGEQRNAVWLIMNGIHPGESEGIDASILYLQALASNPKLIPDSVTILIIPTYNVDGMKNRKTYTRANQNGPIEKGFRASAGNYDLNRDFIKADSKNTFIFYELFQKWQPDVFLDTHTSNGADYQYTMTLISTQKQKLGGPASDFLYNEMNPFLFKDMKKKGWEMSPYVNVFGKSPDPDGFEVFVEGPKFSTGYAALFGTLGFVAETHMLKPYPERVKATYSLFETFQKFCVQERSNLVQTKTAQQKWIIGLANCETNFQVSRESHKDLVFKGYELEEIPSKLGNYQRHYYNKKRPFEKTIPYYDSCFAGLSVRIPKYFIVPKENVKVIERLKANSIIYIRSALPEKMEVTASYITEIQYGKAPYEGHFVANSVRTKTKKIEIELREGDWMIPSNQAGLRYLMEALTPEAKDGFTYWNFFDAFFNEKEGFSDYAFEDDAQQFLDQDPKLKQDFERWKLTNPEKAGDKYEILGFIYHHSPYYEQEHKRIPIFTVE